MANVSGPGEATIVQTGVPARQEHMARPVVLGWTPTFATVFELRVTPEHAVRVFEVVKEWAVTRMPRNSLPNCSIEEFLQGIEVQAGASTLLTKTLKSNADNLLPDHLLMSLTHPQHDFPARSWRSTIGISIHQQVLYVSATVEHQLRADFTGHAELPGLNTPRIIRDLVCPGTLAWSASSGGMPLGADFVRIGHQELPKFIHQIRDPHRRLPLVAFSPMPFGANETLSYPVDLLYATKRLIGVAGVCALTAADLDKSLGWVSPSIDRKDLPYNGWVYVYPAVSDRGDIRPIKFDVNTIENRDAFLNRLHELVLRSVVAQRDVGVRKLPIVTHETDFERLQRGAQLQHYREELERTKDAGTRHSQERDGSLLAYVKLQDAAIEDLERQLGEVTGRNEELIGRVADLEQEQEALRTLIELYRKQKGAIQEPRDAQSKLQPSTIVEALRSLTDEQNEQVVVLPEAISSAQEMLERGLLTKPAAKHKAMSLISTILPKLYKAKFGIDPGELSDQALTQLFGFTVSGVEPSGSSQEQGMTVSVQYQGIARETDAHIGFGRHEGQRIKVFFFFDEERECLVIAKVVDDIPSSNRNDDGSVVYRSHRSQP